MDCLKALFRPPVVGRPCPQWPHIVKIFENISDGRIFQSKRDISRAYHVLATSRGTGCFARSNHLAPCNTRPCPTVLVCSPVGVDGERGSAAGSGRGRRGAASVLRVHGRGGGRRADRVRARRPVRRCAPPARSPVRILSSALLSHAAHRLLRPPLSRALFVHPPKTPKRQDSGDSERCRRRLVR
jgi:hypothetical protein